MGDYSENYAGSKTGQIEFSRGSAKVFFKPFLNAFFWLLCWIFCALLFAPAMTFVFFFWPSVKF